MTRDGENERQQSNNGEREQEGPKKSIRDRVIVTEKARGTEKERE